MKRLLVFLILIVHMGCTGERMSTKASTHIMFQGPASEAISLYKATFDDFDVHELNKYGEDAGEMKGQIQTAKVRFAGHDLIIIDSPPVHNFTFTPSMSLFVEFDSANELDGAFNTLSEGGEVFMPLNNYGFSPRFGWIKDRYGLSWQLSLRENER